MVEVVEVTAQVLGILRGLVAGAVRAPEDEPPRGAQPQELDDLQARLGCSLPAVLRIWLPVCRGARLGPGGVFGPRPDDHGMDVASRRGPVSGMGAAWLAACGRRWMRKLLRPEGRRHRGVCRHHARSREDRRQAASDLLSIMIGLLAHD
jgi:hypothetical protein